LFAQLFLATFKGIAQTEYDLVFPIIKHEYGKFIKSDFNVDTQSEYQCMVDYLNTNADMIGITIADHINL
ncbi:MAG TPA: hypothetical protein VJ951_08040, partial [Bacteroidales bacterium]|nr:hypothetical protein [Bacteroidales bacterium]